MVAPTIDDSTLTGQPKSKEPVDKSRINTESEEVPVDSLRTNTDGGSDDVPHTPRTNTDDGSDGPSGEAGKIEKRPRSDEESTFEPSARKRMKNIHVALVQLSPYTKPPTEKSSKLHRLICEESSYNE